MSEINNPMNESTVNQPMEPMEESAGKTENPLEVQPKKNRGWLIALIAAAVIVVIAAIVIVFVRSTPQKKIEEAMRNTFSHQSLLLENMSRFKGIDPESYQVGMKYTMDDQQVAFELRGAEEILQLWAKANLEEVPEMEIWANFTGDRVEAKISKLQDTLLIYQFREPKTGFLPDYVSQTDLDKLDEALIMAADSLWGEKSNETQKRQEELGWELIQIVKEEYDKIEIEEVDKAPYEVEGKKLECQGYKIVIPPETIETILMKMKMAYEIYSKDYQTEYGEFYENPFTLLEDIQDSFKNMDITFYLGQKKVAAIVLQSGEEKVELLFDSNKNAGIWSMEVVYEEESIVKLESRVEGTGEEIVLVVEEVPIVRLSYNSENRRFDLSVEYYIPYLKAGGIMDFSEKEFRLTMDQMESAYIPYEITFDYYVKSKGEIEELTGEELNLNDATQMDMMLLMMELEQGNLEQSDLKLDDIF
ncbi:MAG: hypothetical protein ACI4D2_03620 [Lachnospiraceae bacterium]